MLPSERSVLEVLSLGSPARRQWAASPLSVLTEEAQNNRQRLRALERQRQKLGAKELPLQPNKLLRCLELVLGDLRDCSDELAEALQRQIGESPVTALLVANSAKRSRAHELAESLLGNWRQEQLDARVY